MSTHERLDFLGTGRGTFSAFSVSNAQTVLRMLSPAEKPSPTGGAVPESWSEVFGRCPSIKPGDGWNQLAEKYGTPDAAPRLGPVNPYIAYSLVPVLKRYMDKNEACFFARWVGYGSVDPSSERSISSVGFEGEEYLVTRGPLPHIEDPLWSHTELPNFWWPENRSWLIACGLYWDYSIFSGPENIATEIERTDGIEALRAAPSAILPPPRGQ